MSQPTQWREPIEFSAGDTLSFSRSLPDYRAADGWSLKYELRGQAQPIEFLSTASADGVCHDLLVAAATTAAWLEGEYVMTGYAVKAAERHMIYYGELTVIPNMPAAAGADIPKTHAQQMVKKYEALLLEVANSNLASSEVGSDNKFTYEEQKNIRTEHAYWFCVRANEIARERAKAGQSTGRKIRPLFRVLSPGASYGRETRGGYGGW